MADEHNVGSIEVGKEYQTLILLDELENLLEDLEEHGVTDSASANIPADFKQRMDKLGAHTVQQVRDMLMRLHAQADEDERDLEIADS